jgi:hypothetical protein
MRVFQLGTGTDDDVDAREAGDEHGDVAVPDVVGGAEPAEGVEEILAMVEGDAEV